MSSPLETPRTQKVLASVVTVALMVGLAGCTGDAGVGPADPTGDAQGSPLADALDQTLDATLKDAGDQGVQAVLIRDGAVVWSTERGDAIMNVHPALAVDADTLFNLGSFGKLVLGTFALAQVEEKRLELDTPIAEYVGDEIAGSDVVTLRMLLSHTSGYGNVYADPAVTPLFPPGTEGAPIGTAPSEYEPDRAFTFEQLNAGITAPVDPGSIYEYQDTNYIVLLRVLTEVFGGEAEVTEAVNAFLTDAGARDAESGAVMTCDRDADSTIEHFAHGYTPLANDLGLQDYNTAYGATGVPSDEFGFPFGDGFFAGNALGAASFLDALFTGETVLDPATVEMMIEPTEQALAADDTTGLSTSRKTIDGIEWQGHGGSFGGFTSASFTDMESGATLVVLTNRGRPSPTVAASLWEALAATYAESGD